MIVLLPDHCLSFYLAHNKAGPYVQCKNTHAGWLCLTILANKIRTISRQKRKIRQYSHVFIYLMLIAFTFPYILSPMSYTRDMYEK